MYRFLLLAAVTVFQLQAMDEDFYGNGRRFLTSSDNYVTTAAHVVAVSSAVSSHDQYDFDRPTLFHQLEKQKIQTQQQVVAPVQRSSSDLSVRIFGCELPTQPVTAVQPTETKQQPIVSIARTVAHPLVSSGGIMPE